MIWAQKAGCWPACSKSRRDLARRRASTTTSSAAYRGLAPLPKGKTIMPYEAINAAGLVIPTVIEQSGRGDRAYDLFSRLLRERIILVNGPVEENMASLVVAELLFLNSERGYREINMYIN